MCVFNPLLPLHLTLLKMLHSTWLNFWLWSENLICSFLAFLKEMWRLSQQNTDIACYLPWDSTRMCREFSVFKSCRRAEKPWRTPNMAWSHPCCFLTHFQEHTQNFCSKQKQLLCREKMAFTQCGQSESLKGSTKKLWTLSGVDLLHAPLQVSLTMVFPFLKKVPD